MPQLHVYCTSPVYISVVLTIDHNIKEDSVYYVCVCMCIYMHTMVVFSNVVVSDGQ